MRKFVARLARREGGLTALQAVLLLGGGFVVVWGLIEIWNGASDPLEETTRTTLMGERGQIAARSSVAPPSPPVRPARVEAVIRARRLPTTTIPGVTTMPDGRVISTPVTENADGTGNGVTNEEQARNINAIEVAVANSPNGIAVILGDHTGVSPSMIDFPTWWNGRQAGDHVAIAVREGDRVVIYERVPAELANGLAANLWKVGDPPRSLETFARGYDTIHALPIAGLTPEQATKFVDALKNLTADGNRYSFVNGVGEVCSTMIAEALTQAGIPNNLDPSAGPINTLWPRTTVEEFLRFRESELGQKQRAALPTSPKTKPQRPPGKLAAPLTSPPIPMQGLRKPTTTLLMQLDEATFKLGRLIPGWGK